MTFIGKVYRLAQNLSIDVVLGALLTGMMAAKLLDCLLPIAWWIGFPLCVWIFYTADHLMDAFRLGDQAHTERHLFHYKYFRFLSTLVCLGALFILWAIFMAPLSLFILGLVIGSLGFLHLFLSYLFRNVVSKWVQKELGVALIYTIGVWGGPAALAWENIPFIYWGLTFIFFLLALCNLLIFSYQELITDILDGHTSFVRALGHNASHRLVSVLLIGIIALTTWQIITYKLEYYWLLAHFISVGIVLIFILIHLFPNYFHTHDRYRAWGDGAFLLSGSLLLV